MALLKIKLPKAMSTTRYLESCFYNQYPHLKKIKLKKLIPFHVFFTGFGLTPYEAKHYLINSKAVHALEFEDRIYVHPTYPIGIFKNKMKRWLREQFIEESKVRVEYSNG